jgi:hypothetical protein
MKVRQDLARFTSTMASRRHRFAAVFGARAAEPYDELRKVNRKFILTARDFEPSDPMGGNILAATAAAEPGPEVYERMDAAIAKMETTCRAAITAEEARGRWSFGWARRQVK